MSTVQSNGPYKKAAARFADLLRLQVLTVLNSAAIAFFVYLFTLDFTDLRRWFPQWSGLIDFLDGPGVLYILAVLLCLQLTMSAILAFSRPTLSELEAKNALLEEENSRIGDSIGFLFDGILLNLSRKLNFQPSGSERISLYIHLEEYDCFVPCGRFSHHPVYRKKGRTLFNGLAGCLAKGWEQNWFFDAEFPDSAEEYSSYTSQKYGMQEEEILRMRMKSKLYAVKRINDLESRPVAVIVLESTNRGAFEANDLKRMLEEEALGLGKMMRDLRPYIPTPQLAEASGL